MRRYVTVMTVVLGALGFAGCIVADTTHALYLSPDGGVAWSVLEQDIRSLEAASAKRDDEERDFLGAIARDEHPIAEGLRRLAPERTSVLLLRSQRPYTVLTEARFDRLDRVIERFFIELGVPVQAAMHANPLGGTLTVSVDLSDLDEDEAGQETPVDALLEDLDRYRLVLTDGRFTAASGFDVLDDGSTAKLTKVERPERERVATFELSWRTGAR